MPVTVAGSTTQSQASGSSTITITVPTEAQLGDLLMVFVGGEGGTDEPTLAPVLGFTQLDDVFHFAAPITNTVGFDVYTKEYDGTEGATLAWPIENTKNIVAIAVALRGVTNPSGLALLSSADQGDDATTTATAPAVSGSARLTTFGIRVFVHRRITSAAVTWGAPSSGTEIAEVVANDVGMLVSIDDAITSNTVSLGAVTASTSGDSSQDVVGATIAAGAGLALYGSTDPVRASVRVDALSVASSFTAPPIDYSISLDHMLEPLTTVQRDGFTAFSESLTPSEVEFYFTPLGRQSTEYLQSFTGETVLARMSRTIPPSIMALVSNISSAIVSDNLDADNNVAARYVISYVFEVWATKYGWFSYAEVPDLRIPLIGGDYSGTAGVLSTPTLTIPQREGAERSMLDIVQELLAPFGAVKFMSSTNDFSIQPRYGPGADSSPVVTLVDNDVVTVSTGEPSRVGTKNQITVTKRPYERGTDVTAMQEAYWQIRPAQFATSEMITDRTADPPEAIPDSRLDLTDGTGTSALVGYGASYPPLLWPPAEGVVPADVGFVDSSPAVTLDCDFYAYLFGDTSVNISKNYVADAEVTLTSSGNILMDGAWYSAFRFTYTNTAGSMWVELEGRWRNDSGGTGIQFRVSDQQLIDSGWWVGATFYPGAFVGTFAIKLTDSSAAWTDRGAVTSVTYGDVGNGDFVEASDGGNAIADSQDARGVIEEVIDIGPYNPSLEQMNQMAQGLLVDKMQPRKIVVAEQSVVRAFPVRADHLGRLVQLPDASQGVVVSRDYEEASPPVGGNGVLGSRFELLVLDSDGAGSIDGTLEFVLTESGNSLALDQGDGDVLLESSP